MKTRLVLILALLAGLSITGLNIKVRNKIASLQSRVEKQTALRVKVETDLGSLLRQATAALETSKADNKALSLNIETLGSRVEKLGSDFTSLQTDYAAARAELEICRNTMAKYEAVNAARIRELELELVVAKGEKAILSRHIAKLDARDHRSCSIRMPEDLNGKVVLFDPKWQFVILNAGEEQGVMEYGELLVSRNGKLVSKVIVRRVEKDRSIANVMSDWDLSEIQEGDTFIPAYASAD